MKYITNYLKRLKTATQKELLRCNLYLNLIQIVLAVLVAAMIMS
jgi:hypothetical protein